jgi:hypothetical protein
MAATCISDLVIQEREMDLVAGTHGRGIYKMNIKPIQKAFENGPPQASILFETPDGRFPWINDTHRDIRYSTVEKVPITFFLTGDAEVSLSVKDKKERIVWSKTIEAKKGFNQYRWDLITQKVDSPEAYFFRYITFASPGTYSLHLTGDGIDFSGDLKVIERELPERYK